MIVVDSSGWIEFLQGTARAGLFEPAFHDFDALIVPSISLYEVHRLIASKQGEAAANAATAIMAKGRVVDLDAELVLRASFLGRNHQLALADAMIYATATTNGAELWTQDAHFEQLPGVKFFPKP